ncbi:MAG TPA: peptide deformylase [Gaiellales bacterium]|nr:peptide deformylase [Gaiellales bacterium]
MSEQAEHVEEQEGPTPEERLEWRMNALRLVRQFPDPALRNRATPISDVDDEVQQLAGRMVDIMERAHGVGLAAPQIGVLRRILVYRARDEDEAHVLINPELVDRSEETEVGTEGCLSLLGGELQVAVPRHLRVKVAARDEKGDAVELDAEGFEARVIQHEIDHLDGVLIFDRAEDQARREALRELRLRAG